MRPQYLILSRRLYLIVTEWKFVFNWTQHRKWALRVWRWQQHTTEWQEDYSVDRWHYRARKLQAWSQSGEIQQVIRAIWWRGRPAENKFQSFKGSFFQNKMKSQLQQCGSILRRYRICLNRALNLIRGWKLLEILVRGNKNSASVKWKFACFHVRRQINLFQNPINN